MVQCGRYTRPAKQEEQLLADDHMHGMHTTTHSTRGHYFTATASAAASSFSLIPGCWLRTNTTANVVGHYHRNFDILQRFDPVNGNKTLLNVGCFVFVSRILPPPTTLLLSRSLSSPLSQVCMPLHAAQLPLVVSGRAVIVPHNKLIRHSMLYLIMNNKKRISSSSSSFVNNENGGGGTCQRPYSERKPVLRNANKI